MSSLATTFDVTVRIMGSLVPKELDEWGEIQRILMHARNHVGFDPDRDRDASFVQVSEIAPFKALKD